MASIPCLISSCTTVGPSQFTEGSHPRFHESATTDVILRFYKWDAIQMTRPETRADGFLPLYARDDIGREVKRRNINCNTAVVVVSRFYNAPELLAELSRDWTAYLKAQGFRRVVLLLAGPGDDIDGLQVVNDSTIAAVYDERTKIAAANAAVPAPAGANVGNPSSPSIQ